jgi:hypothetical protein
VDPQYWSGLFKEKKQFLNQKPYIINAGFKFIQHSAVKHYRSMKPKNGMNNNDLVNNSQFVTQNILLLLVVVVVRAAGVVVVKVMVISFTSGKEHQYQLHRKLGGPPVLVWTFQRKETSLVPAGIQNPDHPAHNLATIRIMLSQF